jgi:hypothetical protein
MEITQLHRDIAKLIWEADLTLAQIAAEKKLTERGIYNWRQKPEFEQILKDLEDEHKTAAKREAIKSAKQSVRTLVKLQDIAAAYTDKDGKDHPEEFKFGADVARKAAVDLLEMADVKISAEEGGGKVLGKLLLIRPSEADKT